MRLKKTFYVIGGFGLILLTVLTISLASPHKADAATACNVPITTPASTSTATDTLSFNIPLAGTYKIWVRMQAGSSYNTSLLLNIDPNPTIDNGTCGTPTDSSTSWDWTEVSVVDPSGDTITSPSLTSGSHQLVLSAGNNSGVAVDRVEFLSSSSSCVPTGTGYNCADNTASPPTASVSVTTSSQTSPPTVSGTSVPIVVNAASDPSSPEVTLTNIAIDVDGTNIANMTPANTSSVTSQSGTIISSGLDSSIKSAPLGTTQIIDSSDNIWTLGTAVVNGSSTPVIYRNGIQTCSSNVTQLAYVGGVIYQENIYDGWWEWNGGDNTDTYNGDGTTPCSVATPWGSQLSAGPSNVPTLSSNPYTYDWNTTLNNLSNGDHTITAIATDSQGQSTTSASETVDVNNAVTCTANPSAPTSLAKTSSTPTSLTMGWTASTPGAGCTLSSYDIYQGSTEIGTTSTNSFTATGLSPNTSYNITVKATDTSGHVSAASASVAMTTDPEPVPNAPSGVSGAAASDTSINLSWTASPTSGVTYNVYRIICTYTTAPVCTATPTKIASDVAGLTYPDTGLNSSTYYEYEVTAFDGGGESADAVSSPIKTDASQSSQVPSKPGTPSSTVVTTSTVSFSWSASTPDTATGYNIWRCTSNSSGTCINNSSPTEVGTTTALSYTDGNSSALNSGTYYTYYVVGYNGSGVSADSNSFTAETSPPAPCTCALEADFDCKGVVGLTDLDLLVSNYGLTGALHSEGDINLDGKVNLTDLDLLVSNWGGHRHGV